MTPIIFLIGIISLFSMAIVLLRHTNQQNFFGNDRNSRSHRDAHDFMKRVKFHSSKMR